MDTTITQEYVDAAEEVAATDKPEKTFEEICSDIERALKAHHEHREILYRVLEICREEKPYREADELIAALPNMRSQIQNPHTFLTMMINCGGIRRIDVEEDPTQESDAQPIDYMVVTTQAGCEIADGYSPSNRIDQLFDSATEGYSEAYSKLLDYCIDPHTVEEINQIFAGDPVLFSPKRIWPSLFVNQLEECGALVWDGKWNTTEDGKRVLARTVC